MTKPTVTLGANEWRSLIITNFQEGITFVNGNGQIDPNQVKAFDEHLAKIRTYIAAWHASAPPVAAQGAGAAEAQANASPDPSANGAAPKRGGWPKGRSRKPKAEAAQVQ